MSFIRHALLMFAILGLTPSQSASAALIQLKPQCIATSSVIRLSDLADIHDADPGTVQRLKAIAFQPAPANGRQTQVRLEDIKSRLRALGENLASLEFRGAAMIEVHGPQVETIQEKPRFSNQQQSQVQRRVSSEIQKHLERQTLGVRVAAVAVPSDPTVARELLTSDVAYWKIVGGIAPWQGKQRFQIHTQRLGENQVIEVLALLEPMPRLLVLRHPVAVGHVIQRQDLAWKPVNNLPLGKAILNEPHLLIGREAARALPEGQGLSEREVKRSMLVKRGDTVTVYSRFGAVTIKTVARAQDEGAYGEQIALRTLDTNQMIVAKVVDFHIAEITPQLSRAQNQSGGLKVRYAPSPGRDRTSRNHAMRTAGVYPQRR